MLPYVSFALLVLIALVHSGLGEAELLRPLFARAWEIDIPRGPAEKIFRFAWHLTSLAWVGLGGVAIGLPALEVVAGVCVLSGMLVVVMLRGHLAWPLFLAAGGAAWAASGSAPAWVWSGTSWIAAVVAAAVAGIHVYWATGGKGGLAAAIPHDADGRPRFSPGPMLTLAVAGACVSLAVLLVWPGLEAFAAWRHGALIVAALALGARAVGDGRSVGFSKREHASAFARADDSLYTPLVVVLLFGVLAKWAG